MAFVSTYTALVFSVESEEHRLFMPPTNRECGDPGNYVEYVKN